MMESPDEASEIAFPMVLQGVEAERQLLVSLPLTPFTYHAVLAIAGASARNNVRSRRLNTNLDFMISPPFADCLGRNLFHHRSLWSPVKLDQPVSSPPFVTPLAPPCVPPIRLRIFTTLRVWVCAFVSSCATSRIGTTAAIRIAEIIRFCIWAFIFLHSCGQRHLS